MVSVIIPIYNVQDYLARCVDSVLAQTYTDLEIILVDDGSHDTSGDICDEYDIKYRNIRVIHKTNGGLSDARNAGLDVAQGQYVTFIDGDDYVHPNFVEALLNTINTTGAQIAVCTWQELKDGDTPRKVNVEKARCKIYSQEEAINTVFYQGELNNSACSRLFETQLFKDLRFPEGALYEDLAIIYPLLRKVEKVALLKAPMYYYMHRAGSIITTMSLRRTQVLDHLEKLEKQVAEEAPQYLPAVRSRHLSASFNMLKLMPARDPKWQPTKQRAWDYIKDMRFLCLKDCNVRIKNKIAIILSYFGLGFLMVLINKGRKNN
ncbi:MAG: glycosyltransferase family 2 protein [Muribaculaceae bacterium]|nr:glycosyltransferase family 2 protein [Muribaculaceae bacterium]